MAEEETVIPHDAAVPEETYLRRSSFEERSRRRKLIALAILLLLLLLAAFVAYYYSQNRRLPIPFVPENPAALSPPQYLFSITGVGAEALKRPTGIAISKDGRVFVTDAYRNRIQVFDRKGKSLYRFGTLVDGAATKLNVPVHLALSSRGELWVTDRRAECIYVFDLNGRFLRKFAPNGDPKFKWGPMAIAFDKQDNLYVSDIGDTLKHQIFVFDPTGKKTAQYGKTKQTVQLMQAQGEFFFPNGLVVVQQKKEKLVFVVDGDNRRVQVFDPAGKFRYIVQTMGVPRGIAVDSQNRVYVSDALAHQVDIYSVKGERLTTFGSNGTGPGQFQFPNDIAIDSTGRIYVVDRENNQVQVWGWPKETVPVPLITQPQRWAWCLLPLLLLLVPLLRRKRHFVVTEDFVLAMSAAEKMPAMTQPRIHWLVPEAAHDGYMGRVVDGYDLGELLLGEPHSESDAADLADKLRTDMDSAILLTLAKRAKGLCTEDVELRRLALIVGVDVYDHTEWLERFERKAKAEGTTED